MSTMLEHLRLLVEDAAAPLAGVVQKRAFGSLAFFVHPPRAEKPVIFALVYREDERIAVKLANRADHDTLLSWSGARVWTVRDDRPMSGWVLVPESFHDDVDALRPWVRRAYTLAVEAAEAEPPARPKRAAAKKPTSRKPARASSGPSGSRTPRRRPR